MSYQFLAHTADVLFEAEGKTLEEVFLDCARALFASMADVATVKPKKIFVVELDEKNVEQLLYNFLEEIIYLKDVHSAVFCDLSLNISRKYHLYVELRGDKIRPEKQVLGNDVKAVTMHQFTLKKISSGWKARVIIDV